MAEAALEPPDPAPRPPKYYLVKQHLLELIATLPAGALVPTERTLTSELGTSRTTVRQALGELVGEGRLIRRHGSGTYVAEPKLGWPLQMTSFTEQAGAIGHEVATELIDATEYAAGEEVARRLDLAPGAAVHRIERLRLVDGTPMAVETSELSAARFPGLLGHLTRVGSLYRVLADEFGVPVASAEQTIETAPASPREASLLQCDNGAPMLRLTRHSFDHAGAPIEWVQSWYRGDRYRLVARLTT